MTYVMKKNYNTFLRVYGGSKGFGLFISLVSIYICDNVYDLML